MNAAVMHTIAQGACALVAIKQRARCKMRLASELAPQARLTLVRSMLSAVLGAAGAARMVREVVVISPERDAVPAEIPVLADAGESLNGALAEAYETLWKRGRREFVILPADLPRITADEIDALVRAGRAGGFALASDAAEIGTNALYLASTPSFRFQFGPDSCRQHLQEALRLGLAPRLVRLPGLAFDVDTPVDLARWRLLDSGAADPNTPNRHSVDPQPWSAPLRA